MINLRLVKVMNYPMLFQSVSRNLFLIKMNKMNDTEYIFEVTA